MTISKSNLQTCLQLEDPHGYSGILGQKQTQREVLFCLGIFFSDLLPERDSENKLASAKCTMEEKLGSVTELLFTTLDKEMLTSETPKEAAGQKDS